MSDPLRTYLRDHLTGSHFAINLLESLADQYSSEPLGTFAKELCLEVKQDQDVLQKIIDRVGTASFDVAEATGWLAEKVSQLKLRRDDAKPGIGTFEALETLALGIQGKLALWRVLLTLRDVDPRISGFDFVELTERANNQFNRVEQVRVELARTTFTPTHELQLKSD